MTEQNINKSLSESPKEEVGLIKKIKSKIILLILLLVLLPLVLLAYKNTSLNNLSKQWVNCSDARDVIEERNTLYVACYGGVLMVDKNSGNILDQITQTQGLGNSTTTSLVKKDGKLFIGTQDGFTIFDLNSRQAKKISVEEGLVNGANIELREDGNDLWVGTFDGVSLYKTDTGEITNFREELADYSISYSTREILVTPNAAYAIVGANSESPGGIARFDKEKRVWERFGPEIFSKSGPYARVDLFNLVKVENKIIVTDVGNEGDMLWQADDKFQTTWKPLENVITQLKKSYNKNSIFRIDKVIGVNELNIVVDDNIFKYSPETEQLRKEVNISDISYLAPVRNGKIWIKPSKDNVWLSRFDANSLKEDEQIKLSRKPERFDSVAAIINGEPILKGDGTLWRYDKSGFVKLSQSLKDLDYWTEMIFQPIINSNLVLIYSQSCGHGCGEPKFTLLNYNDRSLTPVELSLDLQKKIKFERGGFSLLSFQKLDSERKEATFNIGYSASESAVLNIDSKKWKIRPIDSLASGESTTRTSCNPLYNFDKVFSETPCTNLETDKYRYILEENKLFEEKKSTGSKTKLEIPVTPPEYSPFPDWDKTYNPINRVIMLDGKLWVGSERGLAVYNPEGFQKWKLFSVENGLVSNKVIDFVIDNKTMWVLTNGGVSLLSL